MSRERINLNEDLQRLWDEGFAVDENNGYLIVHGIPYVNSQKEIKRGILVSTLHLAGDKTLKPDTHVAYFKGEHPCHRDGSKLVQISNPGKPPDMGNGVKLDYTFSAKDDYKDYYEKITRYVKMICGPVLAIDPDYKIRLHEVVEPLNDESVFHYIDTNSSRALINPISNKLSGKRIAIIGLGGTGSYLLDLIAKTPVAEIHLFDEDYFYQHNAFRAPGAIPKEKFSEHLKKTDYFEEIYSNMHTQVISHGYNITAGNVNELEDMNFVFVCMDPGDDKKVIFAYLEKQNISFIDSGIGVTEIDGSLIGQVRTVTSIPARRDHVYSRVPMAEQPEDIYDQNIQIAELNSLAAIMAVIKWKKLSGFYKEHEQELFSSYVIYTNETINSEIQG